MHRTNLAAILFLLSGSIGPAAAQQTDPTPSATQAQQPQAAPVQPDRTPQQADDARRPEDRRAEDTKMNRDWTTERRDRDRMDSDWMQRMRERRMGRMMDRDEDRRSFGHKWRRGNDDMDRGFGYGDRGEGRFDDERPHRRVKICFEYENGDEFCRYRD